MTLLRTDESRDPAARRPDWLGFATFSAGLAALVFGLIRSNADGWGSGTVVGSLIAAAVLLLAFVVIERVNREPMFDFALLRKPTFVGGLAAAFGMSASLFALMTYLVLYLQNILGLSAIETGVRFLTLTGAIFFMAGLAGRLSAQVSTKLLIGPGFVLVGAGLLLMRGIEPGDDWTHLLPGFIVAGAGAGLINVPLASTAVAVVEPARAGMASGINSTFRQIGIATGIAALGSIFASTIRDTVTSSLSSTPVGNRAGELAQEISTGGAGQAIGSVPGGMRETVGRAATSGFVDGLNDILLIGAIVAFAAAILSFALIRQRDYVQGLQHAGEAAPAAG